MQVIPLTSLDGVQALGATHLIKVKYTDLTGTASTSKTQTLAAIPANTLFKFVGMVLRTDFAGASVTELTVTAGYDLTSGTDDADGYLAATSICGAATEIDAAPEEVADVNTATTDTTYGQQELDVIDSLRTRVNLLCKQAAVAHNEAWTLTALFTATGANLTALTAGEVWFLYAALDLDQLEKQGR